MRFGPWAIVPLVALSACRREPNKVVRTEPWPAPHVSSSAQAAPAVSRARYVLEQGEVEVEIAAGGERARGVLSTLTADIDVDFVDPTKTIGRVEADLRSLRMLSETGSEPDEATTLRAQRALEIAPDDVAGSLGKAVFQIRSLEASKGGTWVIRGELALHGIRAPKFAEVSVTPPEPGDKAPDRLVIRSLRPLVVSLSTHDIRREDGKTPPADRKAAKGADEAKVSFSLTLRRP
jgi:polyisoprenoid-binding protein YceI